jgi:hypothetical protein
MLESPGYELWQTHTHTHARTKIGYDGQVTAARPVMGNIIDWTHLSLFPLGTALTKNIIQVIGCMIGSLASMKCLYNALMPL